MLSANLSAVIIPYNYTALTVFVKGLLSNVFE